MNRMHALDGLRGLFALLVVAWHAPVAWSFDHLSQIPLAVDAFFVLSGFTMATVYRDMADLAAVGTFAQKRAWRLWPLHLAVLLFMLSLDIAQGQADFGAALINAAFLHALFGGTLTFNVPSWSIGVELVAYTVFALIHWQAGSWRECVFGWLVVLGLCLMLLPHGPIFAATGSFAIARCLLGFSCGVLCCLIPPGVPIWSVLPMAVMPWIIPELTVYAGLCMAPAIAVLAVDSGVIGRLLACRPLVWLGTVSYSVYMVHWPLRQIILAVAERLGATVILRVAGGSRKVVDLDPAAAIGLIGLMLGATMAIAAGSYAWVERPAQQGLLRLVAHWRLKGLPWVRRSGARLR